MHANLNFIIAWITKFNLACDRYFNRRPFLHFINQSIDRISSPWDGKSPATLLSIISLVADEFVMPKHVQGFQLVLCGAEDSGHTSIRKSHGIVNETMQQKRAQQPQSHDDGGKRGRLYSCVVRTNRRQMLVDSAHAHPNCDNAKKYKLKPQWRKNRTKK